jgi:hypothetical protein
MFVILKKHAVMLIRETREGEERPIKGGRTILSIQQMKRRALRLRQLIDSKEKRKTQALEEYARLIWLINTSAKS